MEMHQLAYIVAVAKHQSFTRAADEICLSQSSLSQQISKLEEELGVRLFDRTTRSVALTVAGREFVDFAKRILADVERSRQCMEKYVALERGRIVIGLLPVSGHLGFVRLIAAFRQAYPYIRLELRESGSQDLQERLQNAEIDIAFLSHIDNHFDGLDVIPLFEEELALITAAHHPLAARESVDIQEAASEEFISLDYSKATHNLFLEACRRAGFRPAINCTTSQLDNLFALAALGLGIAVNVRSIALAAKNRHDIAVIPLQNVEPLKVALAMPTLTASSPVIAAFRTFALDWISRNRGK